MNTAVSQPSSTKELSKSQSPSKTLQIDPFVGSPVAVNAFGNVTPALSLSKAFAMTVTAMQAFCDVEVQTTDHKKVQRPGINYFHGLPAQIERTIRHTKTQDNFNIGYVVCESTDPKSQFGHKLEALNEIWTSSTWCAQQLQSLGKPVKIVPHCTYDHALYPEPGGPFIFLNMFDGGSRLYRKNPMGLIEAFKKAFGEKDKNVRLVIKHHNTQPEILDYLIDLAGHHPISFAEGRLTEQHLTHLMLQSHCYVSLHKAEGFGLPLLDMMALGKPTIATGYSGNLDFQNSENSLLVNYEVKECDDEYYEGDYAFPDIDHAAYHMKQIFESTKLRRHLSQEGFKTGLQWTLARTIGAVKTALNL